MIVPNIASKGSAEPAVCYATGWPQPKHLQVYSQSNSSLITTRDVKVIDRYTTAVFFSFKVLLNSSTEWISCRTTSRRITKKIHIIPGKMYSIYHAASQSRF